MLGPDGKDRLQIVRQLASFGNNAKPSEMRVCRGGGVFPVVVQEEALARKCRL